MAYMEGKQTTQKEALHQWYRPGSQETTCILMSNQLHLQVQCFSLAIIFTSQPNLLDHKQSFKSLWTLFTDRSFEHKYISKFCNQPFTMSSSIRFYRKMRRSKEIKDLLSSINTVNASQPLRGSMENFTDIFLY